MRSWSPDEIADGGERVSHLERDFTYFAHLSIYEYATALTRGRAVLDVGCGAGYGTAHLLERGATSVLGLDVSEKAVAFCRHHFNHPHLEFRCLPAERVGELPPQAFDVVFSSNALEHVGELATFLHGAWTVLRPSGAMLIAVPPITNDLLLYQNLVNRYHVNLWSPRQWGATLDRYFEDVTPILHGVREIGRGPTPDDLLPAPGLDETTFVFARGSVDEMYRTPTLTAIFLATRPRRELSDAAAPICFIDESFTRAPGVVDPALAQRLRALAPTRTQRAQALVSRALAIRRRHGSAALVATGVAALRRRLGLRRQKAEGGRQKAEGRRQKAES